MLENKNISQNIRAVDKNQFYAGSGSNLGLSYGPTPPPPQKKRQPIPGRNKTKNLMATCEPILMLS